MQNGSCTDRSVPGRVCAVTRESRRRERKREQLKTIERKEGEPKYEWKIQPNETSLLLHPSLYLEITSNSRGLLIDFGMPQWLHIFEIPPPSFNILICFFCYSFSFILPSPISTICFCFCFFLPSHSYILSLFFILIFLLLLRLFSRSGFLCCAMDGDFQARISSRWDSRWEISGPSIRDGFP